MEGDVADSANGDRRVPYDPALATDRDIMLYRISGAFFFGAAAGVAAALDRIGEHPRAYVIDFSAVPMIDSTAAATIEGFVHRAHRRGAAVYLAAARPEVRRQLVAHGLGAPEVRFKASVASALESARQRLRHREREPQPAPAV